MTTGLATIIRLVFAGLRPTLSAPSPERWVSSSAAALRWQREAGGRRPVRRPRRLSARPGRPYGRHQPSRRSGLAPGVQLGLRRRDHLPRSRLLLEAISERLAPGVGG